MSTNITVRVMRKDYFKENFPDVNLDDLPIHVTMDTLIHCPELGDSYPAEHPAMSLVLGKVQRLLADVKELEKLVDRAVARRVPASKVKDVGERISRLLAQVEVIKNTPPIDPDVITRHERCVEAWEFFNHNADKIKLGSVYDWEDD